MARNRDIRKAEKEERLFECMSKDFFVTRGYLRARSGISYTAIAEFLLDNEDRLIVSRIKTSPTTGRAEVAYKLK